MQSPRKLVLIGNSGSGKTSLCGLLKGYSVGTLPKTIGCDVIPYLRNEVVYSIWDTAGDPSLMVMGPIYYMAADCIAVVHGGQGYKTPEQWEELARKTVPTAVIWHLDAPTLEEKQTQLLTLLDTPA